MDWFWRIIEFIPLRIWENLFCSVPFWIGLVIGGFLGLFASFKYLIPYHIASKWFEEEKKHNQAEEERRKIEAEAEKKAFTFNFGIYWDEKKNPYCPHCRGHLEIYIPAPQPKKGDYLIGKSPSTDEYFSCKNCRATFYPTDRYGKKVSLDYAIDNCR